MTDPELPPDDLDEGGPPIEDPAPEDRAGASEDGADRSEIVAAVGVAVGAPKREEDVSEKLPPGRPLRSETGLGFGADVFGTGRRTVPGTGQTLQGANVDDLAMALSAMGNQIKMRVKRVEPRDLPTVEMGVWPDIRIPQQEVAKARDYIHGLLQKEFGGGEYLVTLISEDPQNTAENRTITIHLSGDWIPRTHAGRAYFNNVYLKGFVPGMNMTPSASEAEVSAGVTVATKALDMVAAEKQQLREMEARARASGDTSLAGVIQAFAPLLDKRGGGTDWVALLGAVMPLLTLLIQQGNEARKGQREEFLLMMKEMRGAQQPQTPAEQLAFLQSMMNMTTERMKAELAAHGKFTDIALQQAVAAMRKGGDEEGAGIMGAIADAIRERGGDAMVKGLELLQGVVGNPAEKQQFGMMAQRIQQLEAELSRRGAALPPPAPVPALPPPPPPPAQGAPAPAQPPEAAPAGGQSAGGQTAPAPAAHEAAPSMGQSVPLPEGVPDPIEQGRARANQAVAQFLYFLLVNASQHPDPESAWAAPIEQGGANLADIYGVCPQSFRERVEKAPKEGDISFVEWVRDVDHPHAASFAMRLSDYCKGVDPKAMGWVRSFLAVGPWVPEDDDDGEG